MGFFISMGIWLFSVTTHGYSLPLEALADKMVKQSGSSGYELEQELHFPQSEPENSNEALLVSPERLVLAEKWIVAEDGRYRISLNQQAQGSALVQQILFDSVFDPLRRRWNRGGQIVTESLPRTVVEGLFFTKSPGIFLQRLKDMGYSGNQTEAGQIRRFEGRPHLVFGSRSKGLEIWFEQDRNQIRRMIFSNDVEITFSDYGEYRKGLQLPKHTTYRWIGARGQSVEVQMQLLRVTASRGDRSKKLLDSKNLSPSNWPRDTMGGGVLSAFYGNFR